MKSNTNGQVTVSTTADLRNALAAGHNADQIVIASNDEAVAAARAEGETAGRAAATDAAVQAERTRIAGLQALSRAGFEKELQAAIDAGDTTEKFALTLLNAAGERGVTLDALRKDAPPATSHAKPGDAGVPRAKNLSPTNIFAARRKAASTTQ